jgi:hypothetical protein
VAGQLACRAVTSWLDWRPSADARWLLDCCRRRRRLTGCWLFLCKISNLCLQCANVSGRSLYPLLHPLFNGLEIYRAILQKLCVATAAAASCRW